MRDTCRVGAGGVELGHASKAVSALAESGERVRRRRAGVADEYIEKLLDPDYVPSLLDGLDMVVRGAKSYPDYLSNLAYQVGYIQHFLGESAEESPLLHLQQGQRGRSPRPQARRSRP
jgi:hypothetical protein